MADRASLLTDARRRQFREAGYFVVEGLFTTDEVEAVRREITAIVDRHPDVPPDLVQMEPAVQRGEVVPASKELGVRKLFHMALYNDFFRRLAFHPGMVEIAVGLLGPDVKLFQSMLLMKPPHFGMPKVWHQDNAYFRVRPPDVFGFWVACDEATPANGCMHVVPGSHRRRLQAHDTSRGDLGLIAEPPEGEVAPLPMKPGDALVFHSEVFHYTPDNTTPHRRRALQYHYASSKCAWEDPQNRMIKGAELRVAGREYEGCI
jgi:phytanoyl-CoA hydroxylase